MEVGSLVVEVPDIAESLGTMQDFSGFTCFSMTEGDQIQLVDTRDHKVYWVASSTTVTVG